jgi:hypothetical protein
MKKKAKTINQKPKLRDGKKLRFSLSWKEIILLLLLVSVWPITKVVLHLFLHEKTPASILSSEWKMYTPAGTRLSVTLPGEPQPESVGLPESVDDAVKEVRRYRYSVKDFQVGLWDISYAEGAQTDIQRAAEGAAATLRGSKGVTDYKDKVTPLTRSNRSGVLITGTFKRDGEGMELGAILLGESSKLWQVIVTHPAKDHNGQIAMKKILDSLEIQ